MNIWVVSQYFKPEYGSVQSRMHGFTPINLKKGVSHIFWFSPHLLKIYDLTVPYLLCPMREQVTFNQWEGRL